MYKYLLKEILLYASLTVSNYGKSAELAFEEGVDSVEDVPKLNTLSSFDEGFLCYNSTGYKLITLSENDLDSESAKRAIRGDGDIYTLLS